MVKPELDHRIVDGVTASPRRAVLSLLEASALSACSVEDLLLKGGRGELRICTRVPENLVVHSTNRGLIDIADPMLTGLERRQREDLAVDMTALAIRDVQLLVLRESDCETAVAQGEAFQSLFVGGVRSEATGIPVVVEPFAPKEPAGLLDSRPFRIFACYPRTIDPNNWASRRTVGPVRLRVTLDSMRILRADLNSMMDVQQEPVRFDIGFVEAPYMPRTLVKLYEATMAHWDCSRPNWEEPKQGRVEETLKELDDYKGKMAQAGATLLRRSFAHWNQQHYELRKAEGRITEFESLVVVASAWRTDAGSKEDADNMNAQYRDKVKAFEYWRSFGIKDYLAKYAWQMVSPKHARLTGRPTGKQHVCVQKNRRKGGGQDGSSLSSIMPPRLDRS